MVFIPRPFEDNLQDFVHCPIDLKARLVSVIDLRHGQPKLGCQGLGQRHFQDVIYLCQAGHVVGESVVFHQTAEFRLVPRNDTEHGVIEQFRPGVYLPEASAPTLTSIRNDVLWHAKSNASIHAPSPKPVVLGVCLDGLDLVAEEVGGFCSRVGDQGFRF